MRILILSNSAIDKDADLHQWSLLAEPDEIHLFFEESAIKEFIDKHLIKEQKHADLIVIYNREKNGFEFWEERSVTQDDSLIDWIRESEDEYSDNNFNLKAIPVVIFDAELSHKQYFIASFKNKKYDLIRHPYSFEYDEVFLEVVGRPIYHWIQRIGSELDSLDLDLQFNFQRSRLNKIDTLGFEILSESFVRKRQSLDYLWVGNNIWILDQAADKLSKLTRESLSNRKIRNEKEFHKALVLCDENYKESLYEKHFYLPNSLKYVEPDFINIPYRHSFAKPEIFEVKLPNQRLFDIKTGIPSSYFLRSVSQVANKYKDYFSDGRHEDEIMKRASLKIQEMRYTLLIGSSQEKEDNISSVSRLENENDIVILSYEEMIYRYARLFDRIKKFRLN